MYNNINKDNNNINNNIYQNFMPGMYGIYIGIPRFLISN